MAWIEPIYDRTEHDVQYVKDLYARIKERVATADDIVVYKNDLKGAINESDLQRIVNNMNYIANLLSISITTQTVPDIPRVAWYSILLDNLTQLLNAYMKHSDTPGIPVQPLNTYEKWNTIEKILWDIKDIYELNVGYHAGDELYGNDNFII